MSKTVLGILAHVDAGKTTLSESILYLTGSIRKLGRVDNKDAFLDTYSLERERGIFCWLMAGTAVTFRSIRRSCARRDLTILRWDIFTNRGLMIGVRWLMPVHWNRSTAMMNDLMVIFAVFSMKVRQRSILFLLRPGLISH